MEAAGATLRLRDQKNGWKNVCIHQQHNGNKYHCPVRALANIIINIRSFTNDTDTYLSTYRDKKAKNVTDKDMRKGIKWRLRCWSTRRTRASRSTKSTRIRLELEGQMPFTWRAIYTGKYNRWGDGGATLSKNILVTPSPRFRMECQQQ